MKKIILAMIVLLTVPSLALAQDPAETTNVLERLQQRKTDQMEKMQMMREEKASDMEARRAEFQSKFEERKQEFEQKLEERKTQFQEKRARLAEQAKERVGNLLVKVYDRLEAAITKLDELANRIEGKISAMEADGKDTGNASALLDTAKTKIDTAAADLEAGKDTLTNALNNEVSKEDVRAIVDDIKSAIKEAHAALVAVIEELKGLGTSE